MRSPKSTILSTLTLVALSAIGLFVTASPAFAVSVDYATTGSFNGAASTVTATYTGVHGATLTFNGYTDDSDVPPTSIELGTFSVLLPNSNSAIVPANTDYFSLVVTQTSPVPTTVGVDSPDYLSGSISASTNSLTVTFNQVFFTINGVQYQIENSGGNQNQVTFGSDGTTINAEITAVMGNGGQGTPEPALYGLTGVALIVLFAVGFKRRRKSVSA
jgi:hypothetical protein